MERWNKRGEKDGKKKTTKDTEYKKGTQTFSVLPLFSIGTNI